MALKSFTQTNQASALSLDDAVKYANKWVARNIPSSTVVASGTTINDVREELKKRNMDLESVVLAYNPNPAEVVIQ